MARTTLWDKVSKTTTKWSSVTKQATKWTKQSVSNTILWIKETF
jgi:hypothetical protein